MDDSLVIRGGGGYVLWTVDYRSRGRGVWISLISADCCFCAHVS